MIKKSVRVLLAYILGVAVSLFLAPALSPIINSSVKLFSTVTALFTLSLVYSAMWRAGRYDALKGYVSPLNALRYISLFIIIVAVILIIEAIFKPTGTVKIPEAICVVFMFPFHGFFTDKTILPATLVCALIVVTISVIAYYIGTTGFSIKKKLFKNTKNKLQK